MKFDYITVIDKGTYEIYVELWDCSPAIEMALITEVYHDSLTIPINDVT